MGRRDGKKLERQKWDKAMSKRDGTGIQDGICGQNSLERPDGTVGRKGIEN
jgi:hypothetical protein